MMVTWRARLGGWVYQLIRRWLIVRTHLAQQRAMQAIDLEAVVEKGDRLIKGTQLFLSPLAFSFRVPHAIGVSVHGLQFPSPLVISAFKDDVQILGFWMNFGMGGAILKTIMRNPREGNPRPRLQAVEMPGMRGLLNAMGLPGKGVDGTINHIQKSWVARSVRPIGLSVGGESVGEYFEVIERLEDGLRTVSFPRFYELNISCPNTDEGQHLLHTPGLFQTLLEGVRARTDAVISVKFSPDQPNAQLLLMTETMTAFDRLIINVGNTRFCSCAEVGLATNATSTGGGGYSGEGLFQRTLEMVSLLRPLGLPIMATGGISTPYHVETLIDHGATLIGMATALVENPYAVPMINHRLSLQSKRML